MRKEQFKKIAQIRPKKIFCPICEEWVENEGIGLKIVHKCAFERFKFIYDTDEYKVFLEPDAFCARINDNNEQVDYRRIKIDENEVYFNSTVEKVYNKCNGESFNIKCDKCYNFFRWYPEGKASITFKFEYDKKDLIKAGLWDDEKVEEMEESSEQCEENKDQEEKTMAAELAGKTGLVAGLGEVSKGFDFKSIANDLGVEFGINPDSRVKSTLLGTVFEYEDGRYRGFDRKTGLVTDYASIKAISLPAVVVPVTSVKKGEMILRNGEFFFITEAENPKEVKGANLQTLKEEKLLPVANPIGVMCYTRLISLGEILGFKGETTQNAKIALWIVTLLAKKISEESIDSVNEKITDLTDKSEKYFELLFPFAIVAFAARIINEDKKGKEKNGINGKNIAEAVKNTFGIDMPELNDPKNMKRLAVVGAVTGAAALLLKKKLEEIANKCEGEEVNKQESKDTISKIYAIVKPYEKTIKKILPVALAICALKLFNGEKFDEVQEKLEGVLETVETTVCSKFGVSNEIFNKENIKKVLIIAGVLAVVFVAYGKKIKGEGTAENAKFTELLKGVAPIIPVVVLVFPQLKKVFSKFMKDEDMVVNNTAVTEEGAVDAEVVSSDETEESFETGSEDKVVENAENAEMKTDSCGNETTSETVTDSSENETATDEN